MAAVDIFDVKVLDNPAPFTNPLQFEITYDVREALKEGILRPFSGFLFCSISAICYPFPCCFADLDLFYFNGNRYRMEGHLRRLSRGRNP